jgi:tetratricopeptide (TPR) repeat protein
MHINNILLLFLLIPLLTYPVYSGNTGEDFIRTGESFLNRLDIDQAIYCFSRAIEDDPNSVEAFLHRGKAYILKDRYEAAMDDYRKAMDLDPKYVMEWFRKKRGGVDLSHEAE